MAAVSDALTPTIFTLAAIVIGLAVWWFGLRKMPPPTEPLPGTTAWHMEQMRLQFEQVEAEIGKALLPILENLAAELVKLVPPKRSWWRRFRAR